MNNEELPNLIGALAELGEFDRVKAWLAGGTASAPRSINAGDDTGWTILMWTARGASLEHLEFARYLISRGARVDVLSRWTDITALHFACRRAGETTATNDMVSVLIAAGAPVNAHASGSGTPLFMIQNVHESTIDVVKTLLRAGASLDSATRSFEERLNHILEVPQGAGHIVAIRNLVASVRAAGSWKAHCKLAHKEVLRLRSLVARGRVKLPSRTRRRSQRGRDARQKRALEFVVRQGDNGIVWNILSYWRETG